ncbi:MAG TPA: alpha/beta hydrolase [Pseudolysinimonas sp.]|nr:alpha/beta hydrolase [Pseudolysinimonas sp.]
MTINTVAEAFVEPQNSAPFVVAALATPSDEQRAWGNLLDGTAADAAPADSVPDDPSARPDSIRATEILTRLSALSSADLSDYVAQHPATIASLIAHPPAALDVAAWWKSADGRARAALIKKTPQLIGSLEGVPYSVRSKANRTVLTSTISSLQGQLETAGRAAQNDLRTRIHMLDQIRTALQPDESGLSRQLVSVDVEGSGRAIIAIGNVTDADYVSFLVPGMFYSVDKELVGWANAASDLAVDQQAWLDRLEPGTTSTVATVAWIGYQTPSLVDVASLDLATDGEQALTASLSGLEAVRGKNAPYVSMLTHSYGSTVALLALQNADITVDALAMVGSPGSAAQSVAELSVRNRNVWVADADLDPIANAGVFGSQPLAASYGAQKFGAQGGVDPITGKALAGSVGHVDYFTSGSESFRNMALIGIGRGGLVISPDGSVPSIGRTLAH